MLDAQEEVVFLRGYKSCWYHNDILNKFREELTDNGIDISQLQINCPGGGRIEKKDDIIKLYSISQAYGMADHDQSRNIIIKELNLPEANVTVSNEY